MTTASENYQFTPIVNTATFPLLSKGEDLPCGHLMGCERLVFNAVKNPALVQRLILEEGSEWHLYGDARWSSISTWIEINTSCAGFPGFSGVLVVTYEIPTGEADPFAWSARNGPLQYLFPEERSEAAKKERLEALWGESKSFKKVSGPEDSMPRYVQSYCIYRRHQQVRLLATYTDLLNSDGIPIPRYRMANVDPHDIPVCRFTLHGLFRLNAARLAGVEFIQTPQFEVFEPIYLSPGRNNPPWAKFHPLRVLRTRPAIRGIPTPSNLIDGIMQMETAEAIMNARRLEANLHNLAFALDARPRYNMSNDGDACMGAFAHRANGGAIYVLPDQLVEEFDNTDCDEIRMKDIHLPFPNLFLKFNPPHPLFLADGAMVDGCYVVKQGRSYLFSLTSRWEDVDYHRSLSVACLDPTFSIHLPAEERSSDKTDLCINEAVERGIKEFLDTNAPPAEDMSRTIVRPDGPSAYVQDVRAQSRKRRIELFRSQEPVFRSCLNIIVNATCFISFRPEDITDEWDGEPPVWVVEALNDNRTTRSAKDRKQHALRTISSGDYTRIKICGKNLFTDNQPETLGLGHGISPRAHWRRGHWRRQRHGVGLSLVTPRWIRPTIVKKDNGPLVEARIYDVERPQEPPASSCN